MDVGLLSVATAVPEYVAPQRQVVEAARDVFRNDFEDFDRSPPCSSPRVSRSGGPSSRLNGIWASSTGRRAPLPMIAGALALFIDAAAKALDQAGLTGREVDAIVTVSSTGIATPSLEARAMAALGFRCDVIRVPVFGLGCAGGASGLALGAELAAASPGRAVLVVAVELCSLAVRRDLATKGNMVALALFGDGAAAVGAEEPGPEGAIRWSIRPSTPGRRRCTSWAGASIRTASASSSTSRSRRLPCDHMGPAIDGILAKSGPQAHGHFALSSVIPAGERCWNRSRMAMDFPPMALDHEREVLKRYGNMSAPTALFVLERVLAAKCRKNRLLIALGPGFTVSTVTLAAPAG